MSNKDGVTVYKKFEMECPWCNFKWTHVFIKKTPPQGMKCSKCGKLVKTPSPTSCTNEKPGDNAHIYTMR